MSLLGVGDGRQPLDSVVGGGLLLRSRFGREAILPNKRAMVKRGLRVLALEISFPEKIDGPNSYVKKEATSPP